jgi:hypothetical protein
MIKDNNEIKAGLAMAIAGNKIEERPVSEA